MEQRTIAEEVAGHLLSDGIPGGPVCAAHATAFAPRTGILLSSCNVARVWGALQAANADLMQGRSVRMVVVGDGLLLPPVRSPRHDLPRALRRFLDRRGVVHENFRCAKILQRPAGGRPRLQAGVLANLVV